MNIRKTLTTMLVVFVALPLSVSFAATKNRPLKVGDKGWKVKTVQIKLNTLGMKTPKTGRYTRETERQVRAFQQSHNLKVTGKVDDTTYFRINEAAFEKEGIHGVRGKDVVKTASKYKGVPYSFGGTTPRAFDCSGFVQYVFKKHNAKLPRTADLQYQQGLFVTQRQLQPGDLVFFSTYEPGASHVGIYAGNGLFWNATSSRGVQLCSLSDSYWKTRYYGAKRVLVPVDKKRSYR
jgi:lipoprotein Spr